MPRSSAKDDPRFRKAVRKIIENTTITVPDAMKCADFTSDEIKNMSLNQRIRRAAKRAKGDGTPSTISANASTMSYKATSLPPHIVASFVFGGIDPETGHELKTSAFEVGFHPEQNKRVWLVCGAAPITRSPLKNHRQVRREVGDEDDAFNEMMRHMQSTLMILIAKKKEQKQITVRHSQERIDIISNQSTHGGLFHHTGGLHLTCDDMFIATEKKLREGGISVLMKKKDMFQKMRSVESQAKELLQRGGKYKLPELKTILKYYRVKAVSNYRLSDAEAKLEEIIGEGKPAPSYEEWTDENEERLLYLPHHKTYLYWRHCTGRHERLKKMELHAAVDSMLKEERDQLREKLKAADEMEVDEVSTPRVPIRPNLGGTNTESTTAIELSPDAMIDDQDTDMQQAGI
eukprot:scaffold8451_cov145-Skeletonema_marinoi.AAC.1